MKSINSKKGAMELSVGTIVVFVLSMSVLVLGFFLVQRIFDTGTEAIDQVDTAIQDQIQKLFTEDSDRAVVVYPNSREVSIKRGDTPKGFAFSVQNTDLAEHSYTYTTEATDVSQCKGTITKEQADGFLLGGSDETGFSLGAGESLGFARLVRFVTLENTPACPIVYTVNVQRDGGSFGDGQFSVIVNLE